MALTSDPNYQMLEQWYKANAGNLNMRTMFDEDKNRFSKFRSGNTRNRWIRQTRKISETGEVEE